MSLSLNPAFVRARYNLAVSCINIRVYKEAAEHLLAAISMQKHSAGDGDVGAGMLDTLKRVFYLMERTDLAELVGGGQEDGGFSLDGFRKEFDF